MGNSSLNHRETLFLASVWLLGIAAFSVGCEEVRPAFHKVVIPIEAQEEVVDNRSAEPLRVDGHLYRGTRLDGIGEEGPPADNMLVLTEGGAEFLDPNLVSEGAGSQIAQNLVEPLLNPGPRTGDPVPGVATHYDRSEDGKVYTFYLRKNARWSDGNPVTAADFVYSYRRILTPETASKASQLLWKIRNGKAFNQGLITDPTQLGVRALDPHTLEIELENPYPYFPHLASELTYAPVPRWTIEKHGSQWTRPENMVVNGPFTLDQWKVRDRVVLKKNPRYWDADSVALSGAVILEVESATSALKMYEAGQAHWAPSMVPNEKIPVFRADDRGDFYIDPYLCTYYYLVRMDRPPLDDPLVRQAIASSIDRERLVKHVFRGGQVPASHLVPEMFEKVSQYTSPKGAVYDPERALRLLSEAGYPGGQGFPELTIVYNTNEGHRQMAEAIQDSLKVTLGIHVKIENMEWKSLLQRQRAGDFSISRGGWCADYPDPMAFMEIFHSESDNNDTGFADPVYDKLLGQIDGTSDPVERNVLLGKAESILNRELPVIPIYFYTRVYLLKPYVEGFEPHFQERHLLKYLSFSREGSP